MTPAHRLSAAFRRLSSVVAVRLVRSDDQIRRHHHGDTVTAINDRMTAFADDIERQACIRSNDL